MDAHRTDVLKASPRMFESDLLDRLSRVHPAIVPLIFVPAIAIFFAIGAPDVSPAATVGLVVAGWLFWTLMEYWIHRLVFHFEPDSGPGARFHWIIHGVHHDHPNDPLRLVMPPSVSVPLGAAFYLVFITVLGQSMGNVFASGFFVGYLVYDMTHYYLHHFTPKSRFGKLMRELHMRHHFQDDTRGFGISAPFWDYVFGTPLKRGR